jgi:iron(III) transport system ATP-binding protein
MLEVKDLTRHAAGREIVSAVSFSLASGQVAALLGPSGSGKTSILRMIAGFDPPSRGTVSLFGRCVSGSGRTLVAPERRQLSMAFQDATLFPHLDAVGNVAFAMNGVSRVERRREAGELLAQMGLTAMDGRSVDSLSGGEAQRVALARALAPGRRLMLLDEPFGNVDRLTRQDLVRRLRAALAGGAGAIIVTHDPADALELADSCLLMRAGRLEAAGSFADVAAGRFGAWAQRFVEAAGPAQPS